MRSMVSKCEQDTPASVGKTAPLGATEREWDNR